MISKEEGPVPKEDTFSVLLRAAVGGAPARQVTQGPSRARVAAKAGVEAGEKEEDRLYTQCKHSSYLLLYSLYAG